MARTAPRARQSSGLSARSWRTRATGRPRMWRSRRVVEDLARCKGAAEIALIIDSPGGDLATAKQIYNLIRARPGRVTARIIGTCASTATNHRAGGQLAGGDAECTISAP
jgi:Clp protease